MKRKQDGFTIVELLIVIVIIAILAAVIIVAFSGISQRAKASAILSDLKATEKAMNSFKTITSTDSWWVDSDAALTGGGNPPISTLISTRPQLRDFLQKAPTTEGLDGSGGWFYDSDNDTYNGCSNTLAGVNLALYAPTNTALVQTLDTIGDDGNIACGKIRLYGGYVLYTISNAP